MGKFQKGHKFAKGGARVVSGPPPSALREASRLSLSDRLHVFAEIIDSPTSRDADRINALRALAHIGLPQQLEHEVSDKPALDHKAMEIRMVRFYVQMEVPLHKWEQATRARYLRGDFKDAGLAPPKVIEGKVIR